MIQELRIGNLLIDNLGTKYNYNGICKVIAISEDNFDVRYLEYKNNTHINAKSVMEPIPLTEEWLVKFGFIKFGFIKHKNKDSVVDFIDKKTGWFTLAERDGFFCLCEYRDLIGKQFRFVHQLQNLYFALTGEELTIKQ